MPMTARAHCVATGRLSRTTGLIAALGREPYAGFDLPISGAGEHRSLPPPVERKVDFINDVRPIFRDRCMEWHGSGNEKGGLNLGTRDRAMEGGDGGPVIAAGDSAASRLVQLVAGTKDG